LKDVSAIYSSLVFASFSLLSATFMFPNARL